tara:strand:+ start:223 stop:420 length:198 start_codon:yes stop_codon:yes gene_type:complete
MRDFIYSTEENEHINLRYIKSIRLDSKNNFHYITAWDEKGNEIRICKFDDLSEAVKYLNKHIDTD